LKITRFGELNYSSTNFFNIFEKIDSTLLNEFIVEMQYNKNETTINKLNARQCEKQTNKQTT